MVYFYAFSIGCSLPAIQQLGPQSRNKSRNDSLELLAGPEGIDATTLALSPSWPMHKNVSDLFL